MGVWQVINKNERASKGKDNFIIYRKAKTDNYLDKNLLISKFFIFRKTFVIYLKKTSIKLRKVCYTL